MLLDSSPRPINVRIKETCRITGIDRFKSCALIAKGESEFIRAPRLTPVDALPRFAERRHAPSSRLRSGAPRSRWPWRSHADGYS